VGQKGPRPTGRAQAVFALPQPPLWPRVSSVNKYLLPWRVTTSIHQRATELRDTHRRKPTTTVSPQRCLGDDLG
jgi:hypothetical protein